MDFLGATAEAEATKSVSDRAGTHTLVCLITKPMIILLKKSFNYLRQQNIFLLKLKYYMLKRVPLLAAPPPVQSWLLPISRDVFVPLVSDLRGCCQNSSHSFAHIALYP